MRAPKIAYSKCWICMTRESIAAEQDVIHFEDYGVCLCERHFKQMMKDYLGATPMFDTEKEHK